MKPGKTLQIEPSHALEMIAGYTDRQLRGFRNLFHIISTWSDGNCRYLCDNCARLGARTDIKYGGYSMLDFRHCVIKKRLQHLLNRENTKRALESLALLILLVSRTTRYSAILVLRFRDFSGSAASTLGLGRDSIAHRMFMRISRRSFAKGKVGMGEIYITFYQLVRRRG